MHPTEDNQDAVLSVEEALGMLEPGSPRIHTFLNPAGGLLVGADWDRADVEELIRSTERRRRTGPEAQAIKHGLALWDRVTWVFVETKGRLGNTAAVEGDSEWTKTGFGC
jgi:hypothetical protein